MGRFSRFRFLMISSAFILLLGLGACQCILPKQHTYYIAPFTIVERFNTKQYHTGNNKAGYKDADENQANQQAQKRTKCYCAAKGSSNPQPTFEPRFLSPPVGRKTQNACKSGEVHVLFNGRCSPCEAGTKTPSRKCPRMGKFRTTVFSLKALSPIFLF